MSVLVQMPTLPDDVPACQKAVDWVYDQLRDLPLHLHRPYYNGHPALVATTRATRTPQVLLLGHLDIVPATPKHLQVNRMGDRYYGRGVFDMKGAIAAHLKLLQDLGDNLPQYDLGLMLTTDEEPAQDPTVGELIRQGWRPGVVINPDATADWLIERAVKGAARYQIVYTGRSGHGSRPWLYDNAIAGLTRYLDAATARLGTAEPCGDPTHEHTTFSVNMFTGGQVYNQIPGYAEAKVEIRLIPGQTTAKTTALLQALAADHPGIAITPLSAAEPLTVDIENPYIQQWAGILSQTLGSPAAFGLSHGTSDSVFFIEAGIPTITCSPLGGGHHSDQEWVDIAALDQFYAIERQFVEEAARQG